MPFISSISRLVYIYVSNSLGMDDVSQMVEKMCSEAKTLRKEKKRLAEEVALMAGKELAQQHAASSKHVSVHITIMQCCGFSPSLVFHCRYFVTTDQKPDFPYRP